MLAKQEVVSITYQKAVAEGAKDQGNDTVLDVQYGNVWTNIPAELCASFSFGDVLAVKIFHNGQLVYRGEMPYVATFGAVPVGKPLAYLNSLLQLSFALNQGNFAAMNKIGSGGEWGVELTKL